VKGIASLLSEIVSNSVSATRAMMPLRKPADPAVFAVLTVQTPWAQGWDVLFISERAGGGVLVTFEARRSSGQASGVIQRLEDPRPLVGNEVDAWEARQTAVDAYLRNGPCPGTVDALVLPPEHPQDPFTVYVLPIKGSDLLAVGGYRRIRVSGDGRQLVSDDAMTEGCLVSGTAGPRPIQVRNRSEAVPDEVILMMAMLVPKQFEVITARGRWDITSGKMRFLGDAQQ